MIVNDSGNVMIGTEQVDKIMLDGAVVWDSILEPRLGVSLRFNTDGSTVGMEYNLFDASAVFTVTGLTGSINPTGFGGTQTDLGVPIEITMTAPSIQSGNLNWTEGDANITAIAVDATLLSNLNSLCFRANNLDTFVAINTSQVTDMASMLRACLGLKFFSIDSYASVTDASSMFQDSVLPANLGDFDMPLCHNASAMFTRTSGVVTIGDINTPVATLTASFIESTVEHIGIITSPAVTVGAGMFSSCRSLVCIKGVNVTSSPVNGNMFLNTPLLTSPSTSNQALIQAGTTAWLDATCSDNNIAPEPSGNILMTTSQTFTIPRGYTRLVVRAGGGGASGNGRDHAGNNITGGRAGAYREAAINVVGRTSLAIVIGVGGLGVSTTGLEEFVYGNPGSLTSVDTILSMAGAEAGAGHAYQGNGANKPLTPLGQFKDGFSQVVGLSTIYGGEGSQHGNGGSGQPSNLDPPKGPRNGGLGAGGAGANFGNQSGDGGDGYVYIEWDYNRPDF